MPIPRCLFFFLSHVLFHSYACVHSIASVTTNTKHRIYEAQVCDMCVCLFVSAWSCMYAVSIVYIIAYYRTTLTAANSFTQVLHRHFINSLSVESSRLVGFVFWTALVVSLSSGDCSTISHKTSNNDNNICIVCVLSVNPNNGTSVYKFNLYLHGNWRSFSRIWKNVLQWSVRRNISQIVMWTWAMGMFIESCIGDIIQFTICVQSEDH